MLATLRWVVDHELNRDRRGRAALRWAAHNVRKRIAGGDVDRRVGPAVVSGPAAHPVICLATYVPGGRYDLDAMTALELVLRPGDTFVDVGASIGTYACLAAEVVGVGGRVVAFEPDASERPRLAANLARTAVPHEVHGAPVADAVRRMRFVDAGVTVQHLAAVGNGPDADAVETTTLDAAVDATEPFVKIDVEGWDRAVLAGAAATLRRGVRGVLFESAGPTSDRSGIPWRDTVDLAHGSGLTFCWPRVAQGRVDVFEEPPEAAPAANWLLLTAAELDRLRSALAGRFAPATRRPGP